jgi:hypothetical protein
MVDLADRVAVSAVDRPLCGRERHEVRAMGDPGVFDLLE